MLILIAAVLAATAFVVLIRLLWLSAGPAGAAADGSEQRAARAPAGRSTLITVAAALLVVGLAVLALTGRLHWLVAVAAAVAPFLRRGVRLIRYLPWLRSLLRNVGAAGTGAGGGSGGFSGQRESGTMSRAEALEILGLGPDPSRDEIVAAHRRLVQRLHPDRGGSSHLTRQLNAARRRLLEDA